jgi:hypothetical protein
VEGQLRQVYFRHVNIRWFLRFSIVSVSSVHGISPGAGGSVQVYKSDLSANKGRIRHGFARGRVLRPGLPRMPSCGFEAQHKFPYLDTVVAGSVISLRERALFFQGSMLVSVDPRLA